MILKPLCNWLKMVRFDVRACSKMFFKVCRGNQIQFVYFCEESFDQLFQNTSSKKQFNCFFNKNRLWRQASLRYNISLVVFPNGERERRAQAGDVQNAINTMLFDSLHYNIHANQMKNCDRCNNWQKKYRVLQAELNFQVKKLEEDMAHQKITLHLAHQKETQKLNDKIAAEKHDREVENKKWIEKYDSMVSSFELKLKEKERECSEKISDMENNLSKRQEQHKSDKESKIREEIEQLRSESEEYKKRLLHVKEEEKKLIEKIHSEEISKTFEKFKKEKEYMEEQKEKLLTEIKQLEKQNLMNKTIEIQLSEEIFYKKEESANLKEKINQLEHTVKLCYGELQTKEKVLEYVRKEYNQRVKKLQKDFEAQKEELVTKQKKEIEILLEKELKKCETFESKLLEIEQKREAQVRLYQANFEHVKALVDENKCPPRYNNQINTLHSKLKNKERQIERAKADIKLYQLQIQNNDEILTKFFLNPIMTSTATDFREKKPKDFKIKNNRGSITGSNFRSPSQLKDRSPEHDIPYNQFRTTSLENLDHMAASKTTKIL